MTTDPMAIATEGLDAWRRGDFGALERILDPAVQWRWFESGEWDCDGREEVMRTLRDRHEQGFAKGDLTFREASDEAIVVVSHPSEIGGPEWPDETATMMRFREGKVVTMQDYRTEAEAMASLSSV